MANDRPPEVDQNFSDCKQAFNGTTDAMLREVMAAMHPYGDRKGASQWLATTLQTNGAEATAQAFQMLANARAEGQIISRGGPWWSKTAASMKGQSAKAKPPPPISITRPKSTAQIERETKEFFDKAVKAACAGYA